jgi:hypothetical protein
LACFVRGLIFSVTVIHERDSAFYFKFISKKINDRVYLWHLCIMVTLIFGLCQSDIFYDIWV